MKNIILLGCNGQIGWQLQRTLAPMGRLHCFDSTTLNLADGPSIKRILDPLKPHVIVNAAAYTAVENAENETDKAWLINSQGPSLLASLAKDHNAILLHYSTDYVFDGTKTHPYQEENSTNPLNVYGASKLGGEEGIIQQNGRYLILRTSWVYDNRGANFMNTMLHLAQSRHELKVVADQYGAPTWARLIAEATAQILAQCIARENTAPWGLYHLTSQGHTSWQAFASAIFNNWHALYSDVSVPTVLPITSHEYVCKAQRPQYSVLDNSKIQRTFNIALPDWHHALQLCLRERPR